MAELCWIYYAGIAQLVERKLPKLEVASSSLVARSIRDRPDDFPEERRQDRQSPVYLLYVVCCGQAFESGLCPLFFMSVLGWSDRPEIGAGREKHIFLWYLVEMEAEL